MLAQILKKFKNEKMKLLSKVHNLILLVTTVRFLVGMLM